MIKAYDIELPPEENGRKPNRGAVKDIKDFLESKHTVAEIDLPVGKKANNVRTTYNQLASRMGFSENLIVTVRAGRLFLVKKQKEHEA